MRYLTNVCFYNKLVVRYIVPERKLVIRFYIVRYNNIASRIFPGNSV